MGSEKVMVMRSLTGTPAAPLPGAVASIVGAVSSWAMLISTGSDSLPASSMEMTSSVLGAFGFSGTLTL